MQNRNLNPKTLLLALFSCCILIASCGKDPDDPQDDPQVNQPDPPVAFFTISNNNCEAACTVQFTNTSTDASTYSWDFGDGSTSTAKDPSHLYSSAGTYTVSMTATGDGGTDTETAAVTIASPPPPPPTYFIRYEADGMSINSDTLDVIRGSAANPRNFLFRGVNTGGQPAIEVFVEETFIGWSNGLNIGFHDGTAPFTMTVKDSNGKVYSSLNTPASLGTTMFLSSVDYSAGGEMEGTFSGSLVATDGSDTLSLTNGGFKVVFSN